MKAAIKQKQDSWRIAKFGELARNVSERIDPSNTNLQVYVGLEHLDPGCLRITRYGTPIDVEGQKLRVRPGQIIFGKRRAYQRKLAVADFEGICSAHAMVLEAIPDTVMPEYLPFFMQSDMFMERAVAISEGSLSPTIKWKALANQKFPLPPLKRQVEILQVIKKAYVTSSKAADTYRDSLFFLQRIIDSHINNDRKNKPRTGWTRAMLKSFVATNLHSLRNATDQKFKFNYIDISSVDFPGILSRPENLTFKDAPSRARRIINPNDVLVSTVRPNHRATLYINDDLTNHIASTGFSVLTPKAGINGEWIFFATLTKSFVHSLSNLMIGTSFPAVTDDDILVQKIDYPPEDEIIKFLEPIKQAYKISINLREKHLNAQLLQRKLIGDFLHQWNGHDL